MAGLNQSKRAIPLSTNQSFREAERAVTAAASPTPVDDDVRTAMCQRLAAVFVKQIVERCLRNVVLTRDASVSSER